jgi:hypothetical protein
VLHAIHDIKPRLCTRGVVANPRDATGHRCGLRLATSANPSVFSGRSQHATPHQAAPARARDAGEMGVPIRKCAQGRCRLLGQGRQGRLRDPGRSRLRARGGALRGRALELIVDLICEAGLATMNVSISNKAEYGEYSKTTSLEHQAARAPRRRPGRFQSSCSGTKPLSKMFCSRCHSVDSGSL